MKIENNLEEFEALGDDHIGTSSDTPMRNDAFKLSNEEKIDIIKDDVRHIMETLGLDLWMLVFGVWAKKGSQAGIVLVWVL